MYRKQLTGSIVRTVAFFWLFHSGVFAALGLTFGFFGELAPWYALCSILVCGLLLGVLLYARHHFFYIESKKALARVNLANHLTIFRITSLPALLMLFIASSQAPIAIPLLVYLTLAFISDTLDGFVSRTFHQTTRIGQYLDSMSDYGLLIGIAIAFVWLKFIPLWFFVVIVVRFAVQWAAMGALFLMQHGTVEPRATILGKVSVAVTMGAFGLGLFQLFPWYPTIAPVMFWIEMGVSAVLVISLVEKLWYFAADFRTAKHAPAPVDSGPAKP